MIITLQNRVIRTGAGRMGRALLLGTAMLAGQIGAMAAEMPALSVPPGVIPPPLSMHSSHYFAANPDAWAKLVATLPRVPSGQMKPSASRFNTTAGGSWTALPSAPDYLTNPLLLDDGTVIMQGSVDPYWYKLTPDSHGKYATGKLTKIATMPVINGTQYAPLYDATAVLPDGRVIVMGGEYNDSGTEVWTNLGAIYDPVANSWKAVTAPAGSSWTNIGDAESVVLENGTFMLASCCGNPDADALLNASTLTWTTTGAPSAGDDYQDEQGYELLPNGNVLTLDIWTNYASGGNATNAEQYVPASGAWISAGNTPTSLPDPYACGNFEIGPAAMRPTGTLVAFGGNTGCVKGATKDPTAIFKTASGTWIAGPDIPAVCGSGGKTQCDLADAPAAVLPDGNILFAASSGYGGSPTHFFEFGATNKITQVSDPLYNSTSEGAYSYSFLVLPTGEVLMTDFSSQPEIYTPADTTVPATYAPSISSVATSLQPGTTYVLKGRQLSGLTQGAYYGDDHQMATNFPIVRLVSTASGTTYYARSYDNSTSSIKPKAMGNVKFVVPAGIAAGAAELSVIANGIASAATAVTIK